MKSINPFTLEQISHYAEDSDTDLINKIALGERSFSAYRQTSFVERAVLMNKLADLLNTREEEGAILMSREMGKPIVEARAEMQKCAWVCRYYAEHAKVQLSPDFVATDADKSYVSYEPLGLILAVMPWNFPFWQVFRFAAPTLMAGNTAVLKHASNVQGAAKMIEDLILEAGFAKGVFQNLCIGSSRVERVLRDPAVKAVSLTGSGHAGSAVGSIAGSEIKPSVLELGGSCGFIVLEDAKLEFAAKLAVKARMLNNGQSCIAAKRFIVVEGVYQEFLRLFAHEMQKIKPGDPSKENTSVGPMARVDLAEELERQMEDSVRAGAYLLCGGERTNALFEPAILSDVTPGMPAFDEELFGPLAAVIKAKDAEDAIRLNNLSEFGLGVSIITRNVEKALQLSPELEDGAVFINEMVKSDPRIPFGGTKKSGFGRELGALGIKEFVNAKTVHVKRMKLEDH